MTPDSLVRATENLFSLPDIALRVNQLIEAPNTRPAELADVIRFDPGLAARLLRLVNSAAFARRQPVETMTQAINLIGYRTLRDLVLATCVVDLFKGLPSDRIDMERFWFHGVACGVTAGELAARGGLREGERLFLTGLMHSLGRLIFFSQCADEYREVMRLTEQESLDAIAAEQRVFGFNYADLGAELLKSWRFPETIWKVVAQHLTPATAIEYPIETEILSVAVRVADLLVSSARSGADAQPAPAADMIVALRVLAGRLDLEPESFDDLPEWINLRCIEEVFEVMMPGSALIL